MEFLTDTLFMEFGRTDYLGGIDNEGLDFGQLDQFIHVANDTESTNGHDNTVPNNCTQSRNSNGVNGQSTDVDDISASSSATLANASLNASTTAQTHLPESPPDSGSEPPYSPTDLQGLGIVGTSNVTTSLQRNIHQQGSPGISSASLATIADFAQTSIDLQQNHLSILTTHNGHHQHEKLQQPQHHIQNGSTSYLHMDHHNNDQHIHSQHSLVSIDEMTVCKQESILLQQPESQIMPPTQNDNQLMDTYRSELSQGNLLNIGSGQLSTDDLSRLMSTDVYSPTSPTITIRGCQLTPHTSRKRKISHTDVNSVPLVKPEPSPSLSPICQQNFEHSQNLTALRHSPEHCSNNLVDANGQYCDSNGAANGSSPNGEACSLQCIRFSPFQQQSWHTLCNQSLQDLPLPYYNVDADKGFNFSNSDEAYVCQKKNHFQITCHAKLHGSAVFVRTLSGLEKIKSFHLHFYGVKLEAPNHTIRIEQSQSDRSKKPFHPVPIDLQSDIVSKVTVVRLHFSETTSNNMRKKGRPNPEQRYFQLVVGLHAHTHSGHFPIISHGSERIIVRASNPGQFESDVELCWQRGVTPESIFHAGRVGINTDRPDESLVVHGNLKVSGHIVQPSDSRAKQEISELDSSEQLKNLQKIRIVKYRYEPEFAAHSGLRNGTDDVEIVDTGVIAQEVREVLPDAVQEAGNIVLSNGQVIEKFLLVNKDRILMENIGAVKELCKVTGSLETRIEQLEKINSRLIRMQQLGRKKNCSLPKCKHLINDDYDLSDEICSNTTIQKIIVILVVIMAMCLLAISALYFVEHRQHYISSSTFSSREHIYKQSPVSDKQQPEHQQLSQQQDKLKLRYEMNYPIATGDIPGNDIDYPIGWKYQFQSSISSPNPRDMKNSGTTMLSLSNNQVSVGNDYDTDNLAIIPAPLGGDSSEKISENNMPINSFESERNKKTVKGKLKSLTQTSPNPKKVQYQLHITSQQDDLVHNAREKITANRPNLENKSHSDTAEDQDLQYLSNNNDSDDQFPMENIVQVNNFATRNHSINALRIGTPFLCESIKTETIDCQSLCCEESNKLLEMPEIGSDILTLNHTRGSNEKNTLLPNNSASSLCSAANTLQPNNNNKVDTTLPLSFSGGKQETFEVDSIIQETSSLFSEQHEAVADSSKRSDRKYISSPSGRSTGADNSMLVDAFFNGDGGNKSFGNNVSNDPNRITSDGGCYPVLFFIRSASFNTSGGKEEVCLSGKRVKHAIYTVAISKYMRETKIELHFLGPSSLQWNLCDQRENSLTGTVVADARLMKNSSESHTRGTSFESNGGIFQLYQSKSIFHLQLPNYGFFEKRFIIRAGYDYKSICQDQVEDSNKLLQYNFRIFRDCN